MPPSTTAACAAGTLRRATRAVARLYDAHLARAGLTTTQYSLLASLHARNAPLPLTELAAEQVLERTSLYRALEPLRRDKLIAFSAGRGGGKLVALTARGARRVSEARPHWQEAQDTFLEEIAPATWNGLAKRLAAIADGRFAR